MTSPLPFQLYRKWLQFMMLIAVILSGLAASAQEVVDERGDDLLDRPISLIEILGLERVSEQFVRNNIRAAEGDPYDPAIVISDVHRLTRLAEFRHVDAIVELREDGSVVLIYEINEQEMIYVVQVVGNKLVPDEDLLSVVLLIEDGPRDDYLIEKAKRSIAELYRERGHYLVAVEIDESNLEESGVLIFRVIEGPRVRIKAIEFQGVKSFETKELRAEIKTKKHIWLLQKGQLDEQQLADDVATLDRFYKDRGFLDVRVDRIIELSPDNTEAKVTFLVAEGVRYTLSSLQITSMTGEALKILSEEQIAAILEIKTGDVYRKDLLNKSLNALVNAYGVMGYLEVNIQPYEIRRSEKPEVDLLLEIEEGKYSQVGQVTIGGNFLTKDKVIRRHLRLYPGRPFDGTEVEKSQERIERTRLFNDVRISVNDPETEDAEHRDVHVEVKERNTGSLNFGVALGSDAGLFGELALTQNNFDLADFPESWKELVTGRAFRGAGQQFSFVFRPGTELFEYTLSITEPHFLETNYFLSWMGSYRERYYGRYDEIRATTNLGIGRRLGDYWSVSAAARFDRVELDDIAFFAPTEIWNDRGPDQFTTLGVRMTRSTIGTILRPGRGSQLELSYDKVGLLGGDFDFHRAYAEYTIFLTLNEDFLGRKSILRLNSKTGYLWGSGRIPTYERFYLGGRTLRGFELREVSPKGIRNDTGEPSEDPVGGTWMLFLGAQYEVPLFEEAITGVVFIDSGTVTNSVGIDEYRVSAGLGLRLYVPQFGQVPIAFDFAIPLSKEETDREQIFSFSAEVPF